MPPTLAIGIVALLALLSAVFGRGRTTLYHSKKSLQFPKRYLLFGVIAGAVGAAAGVAGAVAAGGGATNSFCAFFQSCTTPHPHGMPMSNHAKATSATGVFLTCSILYAPLPLAACRRRTWHGYAVAINGFCVIPVSGIHRSYGCIGNQSNNQQSDHHIQYGRVRIGQGHAVVLLILPDVVHQHRPKDSRSGPRREQSAMDCADLHGAKQITQVSWNGCKAAAIHADDDGCDRDKQRNAVQAADARARRKIIENRAQDEEHKVSVLTPDVV